MWWNYYSGARARGKLLPGENPIFLHFVFCFIQVGKQIFNNHEADERGEESQSDECFIPVLFLHSATDIRMINTSLTAGQGQRVPSGVQVKKNIQQSAAPPGETRQPVVQFSQYQNCSHQDLENNAGGGWFSPYRFLFQSVIKFWGGSLAQFFRFWLIEVAKCFGLEMTAGLGQTWQLEHNHHI